MLTLLTQSTIVVLNDISSGEVSSRLEQCVFLPYSLSELLAKLESAGLIQLLPGKVQEDRKEILSYKLTRPIYEISLLDVLEATGEHLNCNHTTNEDMYMHYGVAARKLGVVNDMTRVYLKGIKLTDL